MDKRIHPEHEVASSDAQPWLFQNLSANDTEALAATSSRRCYAAGDVVFLQGDPAARMYFIESGVVRLMRTTRTGAETLVDIRGAGGLLVLNFLSPDARYPLTAVCMEDAVLYGFTREGLEQLVAGNPNIGLQMMRNMGERICWLTSRAEGSSVTYLEERLLKVLCDLAREHGESTEKGLVLRLRLTHEELGALVGAHRVSVSRALKALRDSGKVVQQGRTLLFPRE
jgi:CRP-like cAMP-binding protein